MVVPHGTTRPRQISFSASFALFLFMFWTGFTGWAAYVASQKFDYWRAKADAHLMRIKVNYFAGQVKRSQEMMDEVRVMDRQLRGLLNMGSREAIVQSAEEQAAGGPTPLDAALLSQALQGKLAEPALEDISFQIRALREQVRLRVTSFKEISSKIDEERREFRFTPRGWPVAGGYITSPFGHRIHPITGMPEFHDGLDIAGPYGTPIRATADGVVQLAGWASGYGKVVVIDHMYKGYSTRFGHNRQVLVRRGDRVKRGQIIALMGETGDATGPHCHYEVRQGGKPLPPRPYLGPADF
jgi:murein DD-endopeptidase MepM/ murein hydrolase activator NlpD